MAFPEFYFPKKPNAKKGKKLFKLPCSNGIESTSDAGTAFD
jgi:hypothetical protein